MVRPGVRVLCTLLPLTVCVYSLLSCVSCRAQADAAVSLAIHVLEVQKSMVAGGGRKMFLVPMGVANQRQVALFSLAVTLLSDTYYVSNCATPSSNGVNDALAVVLPVIRRLGLHPSTGHFSVCRDTVTALQIHLRAIPGHGYNEWKLLREKTSRAEAERLAEFCWCHLPAQMIASDEAYWPTVTAQQVMPPPEPVVHQPAVAPSPDVVVVVDSPVQFAPYSPVFVVAPPVFEPETCGGGGEGEMEMSMEDPFLLDAAGGFPSSPLSQFGGGGVLTPMDETFLVTDAVQAMDEVVKAAPDLPQPPPTMMSDFFHAVEVCRGVSRVQVDAFLLVDSFKKQFEKAGVRMEF